MNRITITIPPAVSQLLKQKTNRSHYISDLILRDAYDTHKDELVERTKKGLLDDTEFIRKLKQKALYERIEKDIAPAEDYA